MPRESGAYASETKITTERTRGEIEALLRVNKGERILTMDEPLELIVGFVMAGRWYKIEVAVDGAMTDQGRRAKWRALLLVIKAKLEAVAQKISTVEREFLAMAVLPDGRSVGDWVEPQMAVAYDKGVMPRLLPDYSAGGERG